MKILIACYPRVGSRYLNGKLSSYFDPYSGDIFANEEYQEKVFGEKSKAVSSHNRNIKTLSKQLNLKKTDIIIHLIANPYNSIISFFNAWPQKDFQYNNRPEFRIPNEAVKPLDIAKIQKSANSFAIVPPGSNGLGHSLRPGFDINMTQKYHYQELMLRCDFLQHEHHFDTIINNDLDIRKITIKYEGLPKLENINKLKQFLGIGFENLEFDNFNLRKTDWQNSIFKNEVESVYGSLYKKYCDLPDIKIWR